MLFAACGGDDDDSSGANDTTPTSAASGKLADLGHGVTADSIKLGIAVVDYDAIKDFVDFTRGDQQKTAQVFVDYINENGGVDGRKIDPVYTQVPADPRTRTERALVVHGVDRGRRRVRGARRVHRLQR